MEMCCSDRDNRDVGCSERETMEMCVVVRERQ